MKTVPICFFLAIFTLPAIAQDRPGGRLEKAFKASDKDGNGFVSKEEAPPQVDFAVADKDKNGELSLEEAREFFIAQRRKSESPPGPVEVPKVEFKKALNIPYHSVEGVPPGLLSLDVYSPVKGVGHPVMVMIHGGGWRAGDKAGKGMTQLKVPHFVGMDYVYVSLNYRLTPKVRHPVHVQDVAKAMAWVHGNIAEHGGDPERVFVMGHSAGAHLAALVATDHRRLEAEGKKLDFIKGVVLLDGAGYDIPRLMDLDPGEQAIFLYTGAFSDELEGWKDASPIHHVEKEKGIPPFLIFHAGARRTSGILSGELAAALNKEGVPAVTANAPDKDHGGMNATIGNMGEPYTRLVMKFLKAPEKAAGLSLDGLKKGSPTNQ